MDFTWASYAAKKRSSSSLSRVGICSGGMCLTLSVVEKRLKSLQSGISLYHKYYKRETNKRTIIFTIVTLIALLKNTVVILPYRSLSCRFFLGKENVVYLQLL